MNEETKVIFVSSSVFDYFAMILVGVLSKGTSTIEDAHTNEEILNLIRILKEKFYIDIEYNLGTIKINGIIENLEDLGYVRNTPEDVLNLEPQHTRSFDFLVALSSMFSSNTIFTSTTKERRDLDFVNYIDSLNNLGTNSFFAKGVANLPFIVKGPIQGGNAKINTPFESKLVYFLLLLLPIAKSHSILEAKNLTSLIHIKTVSRILKKQSIKSFYSNWSYFVINGGQKYKAFNSKVYGDERIIAYFLLKSFLEGEEVILENVDTNALKDDETYILNIFSKMGLTYSILEEGKVHFVPNKEIKPIQINMIKNPDLIPLLVFFASLGEEESIIKTISAQDRPVGISDIKPLNDVVFVLKSIGANIEIKHRENEVQIKKGKFIFSDMVIDCNYDVSLTLLSKLIENFKFANVTIMRPHHLKETFIDFNL